MPKTVIRGAEKNPDALALSNSRINVWRRCPNQYNYKYVQKLTKRAPTALPLKRGDWLHQLMMVHYMGGDWRERHAILTAGFMELFEEEREEYGDLPTECERIFKSYLRYYREDDKHYSVVDTEVDLLVDLPNGDQFRFIIDLIVEESDGGLWLWDHKTVGRFMPEDYLLLDAQLARYFWAARKIGYKNIRGVLYNEIITKPPTLPKVLKSGGLERRKNIHCDAYTYLAEIKKQGLDPKDYKPFLMMLKDRHDQWFRRTRLPRDDVMMKQLMRELMWSSREIKLATKHNAFPRSVTKDCQFFCDYKDLCIVELQGGDGSDLIKMRYDVNKKREDVDPGWVPQPGKS